MGQAKLPFPQQVHQTPVIIRGKLGLDLCFEAKALPEIDVRARGLLYRIGRDSPEFFYR